MLQVSRCLFTQPVMRLEVEKTSSETKGQLLGAGKSLNGEKKIRAKKSQERE